MRNLMASVFLLSLSLGICKVSAAGTDISGTWAFLVHHADPELGDTRETFVFQQDGDKLSGTYSGSLGEFKVTGTVKGDDTIFSVEASRLDQTFTLSFSGKIMSPNKMTGTLKYPVNQTANWTATKN